MAQCCFFDSCVAFTSRNDSIANYSCVSIFSRVQGRWLETGRSSLLAGIGSFDVADSRFWFELVSSILDASMMACIFPCILFSCLCSILLVRNRWLELVRSILLSGTCRFCSVKRANNRTGARAGTDGQAGWRARLRHTSKRPNGWTGARPKPSQSGDQNWAWHITSHHITLHPKWHLDTKNGVSRIACIRMF